MQQQPYYYPRPQPQNPYAPPMAVAPAAKSGLALATVVMLAIVAGYPLISRVLWAFVPRDAGGDTLQMMSFVSMGLDALLTMVAAILFLVLLHRVYKNLRSRGAPLRYTPGFAVGCWFIPFANFVLPYAAVRDAYKATGKAAGLVLAWWLVYLLAMMLRMTWQSMTQMTGVDFIAPLLAIGPLSSLAQVVAFGLWAAVAHNLGKAA